MADKNFFITNSNTNFNYNISPAREEFYEKKSAQINSKKLSQINSPKIRFNFAPAGATPLIRFVGVIICILLFSYMARLTVTSPQEMVIPTFKSLLTHLQSMPQFDFPNFSFLPDLSTGLPFFDNILNYLNNIWEGLLNGLWFLFQGFTNLLNIFSYLASWLFGISFFGG